MQDLKFETSFEIEEYVKKNYKDKCFVYNYLRIKIFDPEKKEYVAFTDDIFLIEFCMQKLRLDILADVFVSGRYYQMQGYPKLIKNIHFAETVFQRNPYCSRYFHKKILSNENFAYKIVEKMGFLLYYLPSEMKDNETIVRCAINNDWYAYKFASKRLKCVPHIFFSACNEYILSTPRTLPPEITIERIGNECVEKIIPQITFLNDDILFEIMNNPLLLKNTENLLMEDALIDIFFDKCTSKYIFSNVLESISLRIRFSNVKCSEIVNKMKAPIIVKITHELIPEMLSELSDEQISKISEIFEQFWKPFSVSDKLADFKFFFE